MNLCACTLQRQTGFKKKEIILKQGKRVSKGETTNVGSEVAECSREGVVKASHIEVMFHHLRIQKA